MLEELLSKLNHTKLSIRIGNSEYDIIYDKKGEVIHAWTRPSIFLQVGAYGDDVTWKPVKVPKQGTTLEEFKRYLKARQSITFK